MNPLVGTAILVVFLVAIFLIYGPFSPGRSRSDEEAEGPESATRDRSMSSKPRIRSTPEKIFRRDAEEIIRTAVGTSYSLGADAIALPLDQYINSISQQMKAWGPDFPYREQALAVLAHIAFSLLSSGSYHLYRGMLTPVGADLYKIYMYCLKTACRMGTITPEQFDDQINILWENIQAVG